MVCCCGFGGRLRLAVVCFCRMVNGTLIWVLARALLFLRAASVAGVLRLMEVLEVTEPVEVMVAMQPREVAQATQAREVVVATELVEATESVEVMEPQVGILLLLLLPLVQGLESSRVHGGTGVGSRGPQKNEACPWEVLEAAGGAPVGLPEGLWLVPEASGRSAELLCGAGIG